MDDVNFNFFLGAYASAVSRKLNDLRKNKIIHRIRAADYTVWKSNPSGIVNRLGWINAPAETLTQLSYIRSVLDPVIAEGYKNAVLLGMGGSSLAAYVFGKTCGTRKNYPALSVLDTTDPAAICKFTGNLNLKKTLFLVSSKSGTTLETVLLFHYFYNLTLKKTGTQAGRNFIIITDPGSPLEEIAQRMRLRHVFLADPSIGGRFSALSFPGIVPAALAGVNVEGLLKNALAVAEKVKAPPSAGGLNSGSIGLGAALGTLAQKGRNKLTLLLPAAWKPFGGWLEQLLAESTGKEGRGILPIYDEPLQAANLYKNDRLFVIFYSKGKAASAKISALVDAGHPVITIGINNRLHLGGHMFCWEMATAVAGHILGINPFDQPDVETSKILTRRLIDLYREKKELPEEKPSLVTAACRVYGYTKAATPGGALRDFLEQATDYVCLHVYINQTPETDAALLKLRQAISKKYRLAVTIGYGPRYLHSTGQLHKGDAGRGFFIQITSCDRRDIAIPDRPGHSHSTLTFGTLKTAQAIGDRRALTDLGRKTIRFHLEKDIIANINALAGYIQRKN